MNVLDKNVSEQLNELLEKTYDAEKGFKKAADHTEHPALKVYFNKKSAQRSQFKNELKFQIETLGGKTENDGTLKGDIHRSWMDVKALFSSENDESMLEEAIRGEKSSLEEYKNVLENNELPNRVKSLIETQKSQIENGLKTITRLEDMS